MKTIFLFEVTKPGPSLCLSKFPKFLSWRVSPFPNYTPPKRKEQYIQKNKNHCVTFPSSQTDSEVQTCEKHMLESECSLEKQLRELEKDVGQSVERKRYCSFDNNFQLLRDCYLLPLNTPHFRPTGLSTQKIHSSKRNPLRVFRLDHL